MDKQEQKALFLKIQFMSLWNFQTYREAELKSSLLTLETTFNKAVASQGSLTLFLPGAFDHISLVMELHSSNITYIIDLGNSRQNSLSRSTYPLVPKLSTRVSNIVLSITKKHITQSYKSVLSRHEINLPA